MNSTISDRIDALVYRFEHAVTASDIIRWLTNFDEKEWDYALKILENTIYYSSDRILDTLTNYIAKILKSAKGKCVWILPSGEIGKSGHVMAYYAKKIVGNLHLSDKAIKLVSKDDLNNIPDDRIYIVLLDDFSGSGKSIAKFYQEQVQSNTQNKNTKVIALTVASMQDAADYLWKECAILLHGDILNKCFLKGRSVFGSGLSMLNIREFCFQYGELIFPQWKQSNLKPLGFMNSQALIVFEHTTPNNTLPILWFEKKIPGSGKIWNAIFPRFANARVDRSKRYRQEGYYWLSRLRQIYKSFENDVNVPSRKLLLLVDMLKFVALGKSEPYICQVLCLSAVEYEETVLLGVSHNVFTAERTLTDIGNAIYEEIKKREIIYRSKQDKHSSINDADTLQYIPKKFRGMT